MSLITRAIVINYRKVLSRRPDGKTHVMDVHKITHSVTVMRLNQHRGTSCGIDVGDDGYRFVIPTWNDVDCMSCLVAKNTEEEEPLPINFETEETQRSTWAPIQSVLLNAMVESVARARAAIPTDNPREVLIRDGMILDQLHILLCELVGETEGRILRATMRTAKEMTAQRKARVQTGLVRGVGGTKQ